jgi:hyperosmotically inducible protein
MIRRLMKILLILLVLVAGAFFIFGYWAGGSLRSSAPAQETGSTSTSGIDTSAARERGAQLGEQAARTAASVNESLDEGALTTKIKAKMVLDDLVRARDINVTTNNSVVTLTGAVHSEHERQRAVQLARETNGVTRVVDQLVMQGP